MENCNSQAHSKEDWVTFLEHMQTCPDCFQNFIQEAEQEIDVETKESGFTQTSKEQILFQAKKLKKSYHRHLWTYSMQVCVSMAGALLLLFGTTYLKPADFQLVIEGKELFFSKEDSESNQKWGDSKEDQTPKEKNISEQIEDYVNQWFQEK